MKQLLTIELLGQTFTFKADEDYDKACEVADSLVKEIERVESQQPAGASRINKMAILILAALNIANENHDLKRKQAHIYKAVTTRANDLLQRLDACASAETKKSASFENGKP